MLKFASDSTARALLEAHVNVSRDLIEVCACDEARFILGVTEPRKGTAHLRLDYRFHSMLGPREVDDYLTALADGLWGFVNP